MNQVCKISIYLLLICIFLSCDTRTADSYQRELSVADLKVILDGINIPKREDYRIFISVEEYLNDSTFILNIYQHGVNVPEIHELKPFGYKGMEVFFSDKHYGSWVPDNYYRQIMVTVFECSFLFYEHKLMGSAYLHDTKCVIDTSDTFDVNEIL